MENSKYPKNDPDIWGKTYLRLTIRLLYVTPQNVILTKNVITIAAKCHTNAKCNNTNVKCNKVINAKCNNFPTQNVIIFLTRNVITHFNAKCNNTNWWLLLKWTNILFSYTPFCYENLSAPPRFPQQYSTWAGKNTTTSIFLLEKKSVVTYCWVFLRHFRR